MGTVSVQENEKLLEKDGGDGWTMDNVNMLNTTGLDTSNS